MSDHIAAPESPALEWVRFLVYNTHVGTLLFSGGVRWLKGEFQPDVVMLSEVQSPLARARARLIFTLLGWSSAGLSPPSHGRGSAGTLVFVRRKVAKKTSAQNFLITPARAGDKWHPERRCTLWKGILRATGALVDIGEVHLWAIGTGLDAAANRKGHMDQLEVWEARTHAARISGRLPFRAGDFNEWLTGDGQTPAEKALARAGLRTVRPNGDHGRRLDEFFAPLELATRNFQVVTVPDRFRPEKTHKAIVVDVAFPHPQERPA